MLSGKGVMLCGYDADADADADALKESSEVLLCTIGSSQQWPI